MIKTIKVISMLFFCMLAIFINSSQEKENDRIEVYVEHHGNDLVGSRVVYEVKEKISSSSRYKLINTEEESDYKISIISRDVSIQGISGAMAALSVAFVFDPDVINFFGGHIVVIVGSKRIKNIADSIVASADDAYQSSLDWYEFVSESFLKGLDKKEK